MTASPIPTLLADGGIDLNDGADPDDVIRYLEQTNTELPRQAWGFHVEISKRGAPVLRAGLNEDRGALTWWDGRTAYHPAHGSNTEDVDYWVAGHHTPFPSGVEVPAPDVMAAVREFLTTGQRPTCVEWVERKG